METTGTPLQTEMMKLGRKSIISSLIFGTVFGILGVVFIGFGISENKNIDTESSNKHLFIGGGIAVLIVAGSLIVVSFWSRYLEIASRERDIKMLVRLRNFWIFMDAMIGTLFLIVFLVAGLYLFIPAILVLLIDIWRLKKLGDFIEECKAYPKLEGV